MINSLLIDFFIMGWVFSWVAREFRELIYWKIISRWNDDIG